MATFPTRPLPVGNHTIYVTDANGCKVAQVVVVEEDTEAPEFDFASVDYITCSKEKVRIDVLFSSWDEDWVYEWRTSDGHIFSYTLLPPDVIVDKAGTYTLTITNKRNGCSTTKSVYVGRIISVISSEFAGEDRNIHYNRYVELTSNPSIPIVKYTWSPAAPN